MALEQPKEQSRSPYRRLVPYAWGAWRGWVVILGLTLVSSGLAVLQPWPMQVLVDDVLLGNAAPKWLARVVNSREGLMGVAVLGGLGVFVLGSAIDSVLAICWIRVGQGMVYRLMGDLFAHVERRGVIFHSQNTVGDSINRITGDAWCVHNMVEALLFSPVQSGLMLAGYVLVMIALDAHLTAVALLIAPFMAAASFFRRKTVRSAAKLHREITSSIHSHVQQILTGIPVVQAFAQEDREQEKFEKFADAAISAQRKSAVASQFSGLLVGLASTIGAGVILYVGANQVLDKKLSVGTLLVFVAYLGGLQGHMRGLAGVYIKMQGLRPSMERVEEMFAEDGVDDAAGAKGMGRARGEVTLEEVTFGYQAERAILQGVNLEARAGETVAIVGPTGAGKSTMAGLLLRFFDPWSGRVVLDGEDIKNLKIEDLRKQIAIVLQEPFLFPRTIAENIAYGRPEATRGEIEAAAREARADEFIVKLPKGYDTHIGERGATLSGGQRQRLAIARAFLKDAPILILDEPTSALDAGTEAQLLEALGRLMAGRTTFIIAHRLSTIRNADKIVVLENGKVAEVGGHEELIERAGIYAGLYQAQAAAKTATLSAAG